MFEYEEALERLKAEPSLRDTIKIYLNTPELFTDGGGCTLGGLLEELDRHEALAVWDAVQLLIVEGEAYVTVPLEIMDLDQYVFPVQWAVGRSTIADVEASFGPRHAERREMEQTTLCYDLYVENVDDGDEEDEGNHPTEPQSYPVREAANPDRPTACRFPYSAIWPPEALQIEFDFNDDGTLVSYQFKVGERHT